jgi:hypothetical protein
MSRKSSALLVALTIGTVAAAPAAARPAKANADEVEVCSLLDPVTGELVPLPPGATPPPGRDVVCVLGPTRSHTPIAVSSRAQKTTTRAGKAKKGPGRSTRPSKQPRHR